MTKTQALIIAGVIVLLLYCTSDADALKNCEKLHSTETCMHEIYNGN